MYFSSQYCLNWEGHTDDEDEDADDSDDERKEMEIALYAQIYHGGKEDEKEKDVSESYHFQVYESLDSDKHVERTVCDSKEESIEKLADQEIDGIKCASEQVNDQVPDVNKCESKSDEDCEITEICRKGVDVENAIIVSSESFIENDEDSDLPDEGTYDNFDSDCMMLDESMSENEDIKVNVDEGHQKLLKKRTKEDMDKWKILDADRFGIAPQHTTGRYYGNRFVRCHNCRNLGHMSDSCPKPQKTEICIFCGVIGHHFRKCPESLCYNCDTPGHNARDCPSRRRSRNFICFRCNMGGHDKQSCPDIWRQYHLTIDKHLPLRGEMKGNSRIFCCNCAEEGHFGHECDEDRMDHYSIASYTMICQYDHKVNFRNKRKHTDDFEIPTSKRRKVDSLVDFTQTNKKETNQKMLSLEKYRHAMKTIRNTLECPPQLDPVASKKDNLQVKKKKGKKSKKNSRGKVETGKIHSEVKQITGSRRFEERNGEICVSVTNELCDGTSNGNKVAGKSKQKRKAEQGRKLKSEISSYFPRTKVSDRDFGRSGNVQKDTKNDELSHQVFNNEWWVGKKGSNGKNGKKNRKRKQKRKNSKVTDSQDHNNSSRGFRTDLQVFQT